MLTGCSFTADEPLDFYLSICCGTYFSRNEGEGLQQHSTHPKYLLKTLNEYTENTKQICLKNGKWFTTGVCEECWWLHEN